MKIRQRSMGPGSQWSVTFSRARLSFALGILFLSLVGCVDDHKQDASDLREKTAERTAELKDNAKSVAEGVRDGWNRDKKRVDLNSASKEELVSTGLTRAQSDHVIEHRPYANSRELMTKHVLSEDEYRQIAPRVRVGEATDK
jgi:hypothetical protein